VRRGPRLAVLTITVGLGLAGGCRRVDLEPGAFARANVLLILLDTQRADRLGCYGGQPGLTPFLDQLAARSVVFHRAYATAPWTSPSVASLLTSRLPSQHRLTTLSAVLPDEETTVTEVLRSRGFATQAYVANPLIANRGLQQAFVGWLTLPTARQPRFKPGPLAAGGELLRTRAVNWVLELPPQHRRGESFLYLQYMDPHFPALPDEDALEQVARGRGRWPMDIEHTQEMFYFPAASAEVPATVAAIRDYYDALVLTLDRRLAGLFDDLGRLGYLDRAIVVVVADHGEELFDHGTFGHGHSLYEELVRVPLLIALPGQHTRVDVDEVVSLIDVAPTLLDLLGIETPSSFEGRSLRSVIRAADGPWRRLRRALGRPPRGERAAFSELVVRANPEWPRLTPHRRAVVQGDRKLVERLEGEYDVIDVARDPLEQTERRASDEDMKVFQPALQWLETYASAAPDAGQERPLSPEDVERLRALGYVH
jgi:arylsulfatase A-like enzyme